MIYDKEPGMDSLYVALYMIRNRERDHLKELPVCNTIYDKEPGMWPPKGTPCM